MNNNEITKEMESLIRELNEASDAYYNGEEIMSNFEYDKKFDQLAELEKKSGVILPDSPTQKVGAVVDSLNKVKHEYPALSLDKTKKVDEIVKAFVKGINDAFAKGYDHSEEVLLMWKLDGSTVVATYEGGKLVLLATRGNGEVGSDITHNASFIAGLPTSIDYKGKLIIRGEAMMSHEEFERINASLPKGEEPYKNARNLANATIQMHDSNELKKRHIQFMAHAFVYSDQGMPNLLSDQFDVLDALGFATVTRERVKVENLKKAIEKWSEEENIKNFGWQVDGLVVAMEDTMYARTLPGTGHNPHVMNGFAFKWQDETAETVLRDIEWSPSRTGLLNPVAVFDPVELEGTTVTRASLHNVSYIQEMNLLPLDRITVYKANKIIPQLAENLDKNHHGPIDISIAGKWCPCCKQKTEIVKSDVSDTLVRKCVNPECPAKMVGRFVHFCERDCMNIEGMSEATITTFIEKGYLRTLKDLFHLERYKPQIEALDGFGSKSYENIIKAVNEARRADFVSFMHALGVPNVGKGQAKLLKPVAKAHCEEISADNYVDAFLDLVANNYDFTEIEGIGSVIDSQIKEYLTEERIEEIYGLMEELTFTDVNEVGPDSDSAVNGKTFVITGSLNHYSNRDALIADIEAHGGKVSGSVSKNTDFLVNNDVTSTSGKNKKAQELGIKIITENEIIAMM